MAVRTRASLSARLALPAPPAPQNPKNRLELHEARDGGVYIKGLSTFVVKSQAEIGAVLEVGKRNRTVGATLMNHDSSRSHSVFTITVEVADGAVGGAAAQQQQQQQQQQWPQQPQAVGSKGGHIRVGKLNLVDLAGSERQSKTGATGERLKEATKINLSLSALGNVISALVGAADANSLFCCMRCQRLCAAVRARTAAARWTARAGTYPTVTPSSPVCCKTRWVATRAPS